MKTGDRKIFARTSKYLFDLFEPRERDWILLPRGGRRIVSQRKLAPSLRFTALYGKFEPLVSPSVRKQSAYDVSIGELSMEIPSKLLSNFVQAALPPPLPPPLSLRIHLCTRIPIRCSFDVAVSSIICSQRVNLSRVKWKGDTREGGRDSLLPLGIRNRRMSMMVEPPGYEFYLFYVSFLPLK